MEPTQTPHGFDNLGGLERPVDSRDFGLTTYQHPVALPDTFIQDLSVLPVFYQGKYGTCGAHAGATFDSALQKKTLSPKYLWRQIKLIDGFPIEVGTDLRSIMQSLSNTGDCSIDLCNNDLLDSIESYTNPNDITDQQRHDAYQNDITGYAFVDNPSWDDIRQAIYQNKVVIALVRCGSGWWQNTQGQNSWQEKDVLPLRLGNYASGHFVCLYGYDKNYIYFRNSWSTDWGRNGDGYFDQTYLPYVTELGTALPLNANFKFTQNLWFGLRSNDVLQLQKRLGVYPQTGYFGPLTFAAVVKYQRAQGITPTGFCGPLTRASLNK